MESAKEKEEWGGPINKIFVLLALSGRYIFF